jgi:hypothetical protein
MSTDIQDIEKYVAFCNAKPEYSRRCTSNLSATLKVKSYNDCLYQLEDTLIEDRISTGGKTPTQCFTVIWVSNVENGFIGEVIISNQAFSHELNILQREGVNNSTDLVAKLAYSAFDTQEKRKNENKLS